MVSHSQITPTLHPSSFSESKCNLSRSVFFFNFGSQYSFLLEGISCRLHPGCWCQKHPCTNIIILYFGKTISGFPGSFLTFRRKRNPARCSIDLTTSSGFVSRLLIRDIFLLRCSEEIVSTITGLIRHLLPIPHLLLDETNRIISSTAFQKAGQANR